MSMQCDETWAAETMCDRSQRMARPAQARPAQARSAQARSALACRALACCTIGRRGTAWRNWLVALWRRRDGELFEAESRGSQSATASRVKRYSMCVELKGSL